MKTTILGLLLCLATAACSTSPDDVAPPAGTAGMEHQSPMGSSGISTGTSNVINGHR